MIFLYCIILNCSNGYVGVCSIFVVTTFFDLSLKLCTVLYFTVVAIECPRNVKKSELAAQLKWNENKNVISRKNNVLLRLLLMSLESGSRKKRNQKNLIKSTFERKTHYYLIILFANFLILFGYLFLKFHVKVYTAQLTLSLVIYKRFLSK